MPSEAGERTSTTLLDGVRRKDELAWGKMVDVYTPLVWCWCKRLDVKPEDVEDICQEVFRAVYRALPGFRRDRPGDTFRGWLRMITRNKVRDFWGKKKPVCGGAGGSEAVERLHDVPDPNGEIVIEAEEEQEVGILYRKAVQIMRDEFEDRTWKAFWRVAVDDEPVEQVARALGMSPNAVYLARSRIRKRLREVLTLLGEEPPAAD